MDGYLQASEQTRPHTFVRQEKRAGEVSCHTSSLLSGTQDVPSLSVFVVSLLRQGAKD